jgi:ABC-2 type transport system permease protein
MTIHRDLKLYWNETRFEFLKLLRMPAYSVSTVFYPIVFYIMFGLILPTSKIKGVGMEQYLLGSYGAFGVISATIMALGAGIAVERGLGWLAVKRSSPMPPAAYLTAKTIVGLIFSLLVLVILFTIGWGFGGVDLPVGTWLEACGLLLVGSLPFTLLGVAIGLLAGPNSAAGMVNLIHLPLSFFSGLWIPIAMMPEKLQTFATYLPYYHLGQIGLIGLGVRGRGSLLGHFEALAGFAVLFTLIIVWAQRRDSERMYG